MSTPTVPATLSMLPARRDADTPLTVLYAAFIGDGYAVLDGGPDWYTYPDRPEESSGYWYSYRHSEHDCPTCCGGDDDRTRDVDCPACDGSGLDAYDDGCSPDPVTCGECRGRGTVPGVCPTCDGSGVVEGEPFRVVRYLFPDPSDADRCAAEVNDAGDGYERADVLSRYVSFGKCGEYEVVDWTPDHG